MVYFRSVSSARKQARHVLHQHGPRTPYNHHVRANLIPSVPEIHGWPSRGGVIVLDEADAVDFEFLGLNPLDPPTERCSDQEDEDTFCQRLLLLGAKWWDSAERHFYVRELEVAPGTWDPSWGGHRDGSFRYTQRPEPSVREKRVVRVGWPSTGGLWVSEFEELFSSTYDEVQLVPEDVQLARTKLARTMDERCHVLKTFLYGKFYHDLSEYEGQAFLRAWEWKYAGESRREMLTPEETVAEWRRSRYEVEPIRESVVEQERVKEMETVDDEEARSPGFWQNLLGRGRSSSVRLL